MGWSEPERGALVFSGELAELHTTLMRWLVEDSPQGIVLDSDAHLLALIAAGEVFAGALPDLLSDERAAVGRKVARRVLKHSRGAGPECVGEALDTLDACAEVFGAGALTSSKGIRQRFKVQAQWRMGPGTPEHLAELIQASPIEIELHAVVELGVDDQPIVSELRPRFLDPVEPVPLQR